MPRACDNAYLPCRACAAWAPLRVTQPGAHFWTDTLRCTHCIAVGRACLRTNQPRVLGLICSLLCPAWQELARCERQLALLSEEAWALREAATAGARPIRPGAASGRAPACSACGAPMAAGGC